VGYLADNIPLGRNTAICQELYPFRVIITPGFASNIVLQQLVLDELPDVEDWQFSGRRRCPVPPSRGSARRIRRVIHPRGYAQNSRYVRQFTEEVVFAFHSTLQRDKVTARLTLEGFTFRLENEPGIGDELVVFIP